MGRTQGDADAVPSLISSPGISSPPPTSNSDKKRGTKKREGGKKKRFCCAEERASLFLLLRERLGVMCLACQLASSQQHVLLCV